MKKGIIWGLAAVAVGAVVYGITQKNGKKWDFSKLKSILK